MKQFVLYSASSQTAREKILQIQEILRLLATSSQKMIPTKKILHHLSTHLGQKNAMFIVSITPSSHQKRTQKKKTRRMKAPKPRKTPPPYQKPKQLGYFFFFKQLGIRN
jgi:hypothetical protein